MTAHALCVEGRRTAGYSGALGAGLVIFSRFPIITATLHPYSLNGSPLDVGAGDWFVGKAAASIILAHPILGEVQVFNTHVRLLPCACQTPFMCSF